MLQAWALCCLLLVPALANTEKAIFLGPASMNIPRSHPTLEDLFLDTLTPDNWAIRTHIEAQFPSDSAKYGKPTWLLLDQLTEGQRYEVRICWAATQPTEFRLETYELQTVFETPGLISQLSEYSWSRRLGTRQDEDGIPAESASASSRVHQERTASVLFLQILAAADYYTTNETLMNEVPPVFVDIILDPYLLNVLPRSLLPTVGYIIVIAVLSWILAQYISKWIHAIAIQPGATKKEQ